MKTAKQAAAPRRVPAVLDTVVSDRKIVATRKLRPMSGALRTSKRTDAFIERYARERLSEILRHAGVMCDYERRKTITVQHVDEAARLALHRPVKA